MRGRLTTGIAFVAAMAFTASAMAFCPPNEKGASLVKDSAKSGTVAPCSKSAAKRDAPCSKGKLITVSDDAGSQGGNASVEAVLASLPSMSFRVGEKTVNCSFAAKAMAEKAGSPVRFTVADKVYDEEGDAVAALTSMLEDRLTEMKTVQYVVGGKCGKCPVTAKHLAKKNNAKVAYRVAGLDTFDKAKADEAAKVVEEAMAGVLMSYKVGDASFCCDKMAGAKAKKTGKSITFVVGKEETPCGTTAKLMLARAKARTAVEAAAALMIVSAIGQS